MRGLLLLAASLMLAAAAAPGSKGTSAGVYSAAQAQEGARLYAERCAMCHGSRLEGSVETPALTGKFVANWAGSSMADLFDYVARAMPQHAPGTITPAENRDLLAFLLQQNGAPAGKIPLPDQAAKLSAIRIDPARRP